MRGLAHHEDIHVPERLRMLDFEAVPLIRYETASGLLKSPPERCTTNVAVSGVISGILPGSAANGSLAKMVTTGCWLACSLSRMKATASPGEPTM